MEEHPFKTESSQTWELHRKKSFMQITSADYKRGIPGLYTEENPHQDRSRQKLWKLMESYQATDTSSIQQAIVNHVEYTIAKTRFNLDPNTMYRACAYSVRDRLIEFLNDTNAFFYENDVKRCYYISLEFLLGRALQNALINLFLEESYHEALLDLGFKLENLFSYEHDPALGNGGLGRLAACFLDSMASLNLPCWGYGIRYTYGIFEQKMIQGRQVEYPDYWLSLANPWEIERSDIAYAVRFYGQVRTEEVEGVTQYRWVGGEIVQAIAYDNPIPGYETFNTINLRLWRAIPSKEFDFRLFNIGQYLESVRERQNAESITAVLYPNDNKPEGKELRLKQQYFCICATIQDILRRFKKKGNRNWKELPSKMCIQLNDTHPTIAIPELQRILVDIEKLEWNVAWSITKQCFNYTNHTVLPEALEKWPVSLISNLLPRHLLIINQINFQFLNEVRLNFGEHYHQIPKLSIFEEGWEKQIRMANLAIVGCNKVNGVAKIHSNVIKRELFPHFVEYFDAIGIKDKFINVTNGVTPRRWIHLANRNFSNLITDWLDSTEWLKDLSLLSNLQNVKLTKKMFEDWNHVKLQNKVRLCEWIKAETEENFEVSPHMFFDVQVKRIHEYKRQLLFCLWIIHRYLHLKKISSEERKNFLPRACLIGGKAAPGYVVAKNIIKFCNNIARTVNNDQDLNAYMKVVFLPNYNVSNAEIIIPAADVSQHISTAGTEASGTSNMKFVMNGSLVIGTHDGSTLEICEEVNEPIMFLFGIKETEVPRIRKQASKGNYPVDSRLQEVFDFIYSGKLSCGDAEAQNDFCQLIGNLSNNGNGYNGDYYLVVHDFPEYCRAQEQAEAVYMNNEEWIRRCVKALSCMGKFSTDRTINEYARLIWDIVPYQRPIPLKELHEIHSTCKVSSNLSNTPGGAANTASSTQFRNVSMTNDSPISVTDPPYAVSTLTSTDKMNSNNLKKNDKQYSNHHTKKSKAAQGL